MATVYTAGLEELCMSLKDLADIPSSVLVNMVQAGVDYLEPKTKQGANTLLNGPYAEGVVASGVSQRKAKATTDGAKGYITFKGARQHPNSTTRIAQIAFINEYGTKTKQGPRAWIATVNEQSASGAVEKASDVYLEYLARLGLN